MILILGENNKIDLFDFTLDKDSVDNIPNAIWVDEDFDFTTVEHQDGKSVEYYYENNSIVVKYIDVEPIEEVIPEPTNTEIKDQLTSMEDNQYALMMAITDLYEMNL